MAVLAAHPRVDVNLSASDDGITPLVLATLHENVKGSGVAMARALLASPGIRVNERVAVPQGTALHWASQGNPAGAAALLSDPRE